MVAHQLLVELDLAVAGSVQLEELALAVLALALALALVVVCSATRPVEVLAVRLAPLAASAQAVDLGPELRLAPASAGQDLLFNSPAPRVMALAAPRSTQ